MRITRRDFLALLAVAPAARTAGVGVTSPGLREWLEAKCAEGQFPGAALIASREGSVVLEHHLGTYCRLHEPRAPLGPDVRHPLFSCSKLVSATVVGMADPKTQVAFLFATTASPGSAAATVALRNELTDRVFDSAGH